MAKTFTEKVVSKLEGAGYNGRRAKELAKSLSSATRWKNDGVTEKLHTKLVNLGLNPRKATELSKVLAPVVRAAIKAKVGADEAVTNAVNGANSPDLDQVAPRINGVRLRLDLPTLGYKNEETPGEVLRVMDGLTSTNSYLVAAVRGEKGVIAVRRFHNDSFKVKFYPNAQAWGFTREGLEASGFEDHLRRDWYERFMVTREQAESLLTRVKSQDEAKSPVKRLLAKLRTVTMVPLVQAFTILSERKGEYSSRGSGQY